MNKMNVKYDGIGFINNRGTSKYWGVCKSLTDPNGYRVTANCGGQIYTFYADSSLGRLDEQTAATLAASLYEYRLGKLPSFVNVMIRGTIYRLDVITKKIYTISGKVGIDVKCPMTAEEAARFVDTEQSTDPLQTAMDKYSIPAAEQTFIRSVFDKTTNGEMSAGGQAVLKAVLRTTL